MNNWLVNPLTLYLNEIKDKYKLQFVSLTRMNINEKINEIINVQLMIINVQNNARSAPKLKR